MLRHSPVLLFLILLLLRTVAPAQVVINEIHYHPVEKANFDAAGNPTYTDTGLAADLKDDVHEFIELYNSGASPVSLTGWKLAGGVDFTFGSTTIPAGGYVVIAKNSARLQTVYGITGVVGPYAGKLSNGGATVKLVNTGGVDVDSVSYSASFPWAITANSLGADDDFTGLNSLAYQYKGRSLQRVSATASSDDPANWLAVRPAVAATFADLPTPSAANIVSRAVPKPVVTAYSATQVTDGAAIIRASQPVNITCSFSSTASLTSVQVEYFLDNMNAFGEARLTVAMTAVGNGQYTATLPGKANRSIVRYRIKADRGDGVELVAPRADDPAVVQVGAPTYPASPAPPNALQKVPALREAWFAYFVTPVRSSLKPIIDMIIPTDGTFVDDNASNNTTQFNGINGFQAIAFDCKGGPKRTTAENTASSYPRETPYVRSSDRIWNDVVPGVFVQNGVIRDIQIRFHGSRWNRRPSRKSFKVFFPEYQPYIDGAGVPVTSVFETDKNDMFMTAHGLNQLAGLPLSTVRYVDWYFNNDGMITRLEQGEYNGELLDAYHKKMQRLNPGATRESTGELYKATGFISSPNTTGEGPYGNGNCWRLPAAGFWTELQRFDYTFALQNHHWKGAKPLKDTINGMWTARGDSITSTATTTSNPNIANTKAWIDANWDVDTELTSLALANWMTPWDDTTQNHYLWRRTNGKWVRLLWDFDAMYGTGDSTNSSTSIYHGEVGGANNSRGPHFIVDSFLKTYRTEFKQRMWFLNNTLLDPENLQTITYKNSAGTAVTYYSWINAQGGGFATNRFTYVNTTVALGIFYKPTRPTNAVPVNGAAVLPGVSLTGSAYGYNAALTHTAAPTTSPHASSKWEIRAAADTYDNPIYIANLTTNLTSLPVPFGQLTYGQTYFWRVTYYAADGHPSITSAETSFSYGPTSLVAGNITLNEIMAKNRSAVANGATFPDYIELKNNTGAAIDISGWKLTNDELAPGKFIFPASTIVPASGYLVVWCDSSTTTPGLHTGFALNDHGERVILIEGTTVRDAVTFGPQTPNLAIGRIADGTGAWTLVSPTVGAANTVAAAFSTTATSLKVNEWMADPKNGSDWFELYNPAGTPVALAGLWLSDTPGTPKITQIPALSFIAPGGNTKFNADGTTDGFNSVNFKLAAGGDNIVLTSTDGFTPIDSISFGAQTFGVSAGRFPDGAATVVPFPVSSSPGESNWLPASLVINEALTNSTPPFEDAIEIYNPTASTVDVSGWWLSDDRTNLKKYQIPAATTIPAGGYRVFYENVFNSGAANSFSLSSLGDEITLAAVDGADELTGYRAQVTFGAAADGVSFGRVGISGGTEFWPMVARTFGQDAPVDVVQFRTGTGLANSAPKIGPIIINEVMYHPVDLAGPIDNGRDEFIELHNVTTSPVDVGGWRIKNGSDYLFPLGSTIRPGEYILVVSFNPATDPSSLAAFRAQYALSATVPIFGPYAPKLDNGAQTVELAYPGPLVGVEQPYILVDKVEYLDVAPWPTTPDGTGPSLQRLSRSVIGNDVANWSAAAPTPGNVNAGQTPILDSDGDGMPDAWEIANGLDRFNAADAALDKDGDGRSNGSEYVAGTDPQNGASFFVTTATKPAGPGSIIHFTARAGRNYTIQWRANLVTGTWQKLTDIAAPVSDTPVSYPDPTTDPRRFYRVVTPATP